MPQDNIPSQTERAFRERLLSYDRRLKELERRLSGFGGATTPVGDSSVEHLYSWASNTSVASGAFPDAAAPESSTPTRDCSFVVAFLTVIAQPPPSVTGTFDYGCNIGVDTGAGFGSQWAVTYAERIYTSPTPNSSFMRTVIGTTVSNPFFSGVVCPPLVAGEPFVFRHEYYYADIGGLGSSAAFYSELTLIGYPDLN